jgi:hypothetical protein
VATGLGDSADQGHGHFGGDIKAFDEYLFVLGDTHRMLYQQLRQFGNPRILHMEHPFWAKTNHSAIVALRQFLQAYTIRANSGE